MKLSWSPYVRHEQEGLDLGLKRFPGVSGSEPWLGKESQITTWRRGKSRLLLDAPWVISRDTLMAPAELSDLVICRGLWIFPSFATHC